MDRRLFNRRDSQTGIRQERLIIQLAQSEKSARRRARDAETLNVPWRKTSITRRREILLPTSDPPRHARRIRSETRAILIARDPPIGGKLTRQVALVGKPYGIRNLRQ